MPEHDHGAANNPAQPASHDSHTHLQYLLTAYVFDNITDAGRAEVEAHLAVCGECQQQLTELRATCALLDDALGDESETPYSFEARRIERVLAYARLRRQNRWGSPRQFAGQFFARQTGWRRVAAICLVTVFGGILALFALTPLLQSPDTAVEHKGVANLVASAPYLPTNNADKSADGGFASAEPSSGSLEARLSDDRALKRRITHDLAKSEMAPARRASGSRRGQPPAPAESVAPSADPALAAGVEPRPAAPEPEHDYAAHGKAAEDAFKLLHGTDSVPDFADLRANLDHADKTREMERSPVQTTAGEPPAPSGSADAIYAATATANPAPGSTPPPPAIALSGDVVYFNPADSSELHDQILMAAPDTPAQSPVTDTIELPTHRGRSSGTSTGTVQFHNDVEADWSADAPSSSRNKAVEDMFLGKRDGEIRSTLEEYASNEDADEESDEDEIAASDDHVDARFAGGRYQFHVGTNYGTRGDAASPEQLQGWSHSLAYNMPQAEPDQQEEDAQNRLGLLTLGEERKNTIAPTKKSRNPKPRAAARQTEERLKKEKASEIQQHETVIAKTLQNQIRRLRSEVDNLTEERQSKLSDLEKQLWIAKNREGRAVQRIENLEAEIVRDGVGPSDGGELTPSGPAVHWRLSGASEQELFDEELHDKAVHGARNWRPAYEDRDAAAERELRLLREYQESSGTRVLESEKVWEGVEDSKESAPVVQPAAPTTSAPGPSALDVLAAELRAAEESRAIEQAESVRDRSLRFHENRLRNLRRKGLAGSEEERQLAYEIADQEERLGRDFAQAQADQVAAQKAKQDAETRRARAMLDAQQLAETNSELARELSSVRNELQEREELIAAAESAGIHFGFGATTGEEAIGILGERGDTATRLHFDRDGKQPTAETLRAELMELRERLQEKNDLIEAAKSAGIRFDTIFASEMPPAIHGRVAAVSPDVNLIVLDVGADDKVKLGYEFTIYRGDKFIGKAQVQNVLDDMAGARVLFLQDGEQLQPGDLVSTRIGPPSATAARDASTAAPAPTHSVGAEPATPATWERSLRGYQYYSQLDEHVTIDSFLKHPIDPPAPAIGDEGLGRDGFREKYGVNPFIDTRQDHLSTFAMDVDTASYTRARTLLRQGQLPPPESVRVEEFVNAFPFPTEVDPSEAFSVFCDGGPSPFVSGAELLRVTVKARDLHESERRPLILTLAVDTSGSMFLDGRLQVVRDSLDELLRELSPEDQVGVVAYGTQAYLVLPHTPARERSRITAALDTLTPWGNTNVEAGLDMAYRVADEMHNPKATHRVVLCSDGVATSGEHDVEPLNEMVRVFAQRGIYLSVLGFGRGRYNDAFLEQLANRGNGNYAYVADAAAGAAFFRQQLPQLLDVLARDAKIQVDFAPDVVSHYRLLGYENRDIKDSDFRNDKVDAGEVGPGSTVTALYEVQRHPHSVGPLGRVFLRFHNTTSQQVEELDFPIVPGVIAPTADARSDELRFLACVAEFAELLRASYWAQDGSYEEIRRELSTLSPEFRDSQRWQEVAALVATAQKLSITEMLRNRR